jgi:hypothetical protein
VRDVEGITEVWAVSKEVVKAPARIENKGPEMGKEDETRGRDSKRHERGCKWGDDDDVKMNVVVVIMSRTTQEGANKKLKME